VLRLQVCLLALCVVFALMTATAGIYAFYTLSDLRSSNELLLREHAKLVQRYEDLLFRSQELESRYRELKSSYLRISEENARLSNESILFHKELAELKGEVSILKENLSKIKGLYQILLANYSSLNASYTSVREDYKKLKTLVESISSRSLLKPKDLPKILRTFLPDSQELRPLVLEELKLSKYDEPAVKAERLLTWMLIYLQYAPDDFHEMVLNDSVWSIMDYMSSPLETLRRGGGDCEDLAALSYIVLSIVSGDGESVYLIGLEGASPYAHMALFYKAPEGFIILDPAGLYATDMSYRLKIILERQLNGARATVTIYLDPLRLNPDLKLELMKNELAKLTPVNGSAIKLEPVEDAVYEWIKIWEMQIPKAHVSFIANSTFYKTFNSTQEFINFIEAGNLG